MLVQALSNPSGLVRENAIEALGRAGYSEGVGPLIQLMMTASAAAAAGGGGSGVRSNLYVGLQTAYVQDFNVEIAQGSSIADPIVGVLQSGVVFDVTVGGVSNIPITTEVWDTARALTRLTGERLGTSPSAWLKWWEANRYRYVPGASEHPTDTRDG
jgi:HEAT repeat protein